MKPLEYHTIQTSEFTSPPELIQQLITECQIPDLKIILHSLFYYAPNTMMKEQVTLLEQWIKHSPADNLWKEEQLLAQAKLAQVELRQKYPRAEKKVIGRPNLVMSGSIEALGQFAPHNNVITINPKQTDFKRVKHTYLHELSHAVFTQRLFKCLASCEAIQHNCGTLKKEDWLQKFLDVSILNEFFAQLTDWDGEDFSTEISYFYQPKYVHDYYKNSLTIGLLAPLTRDYCHQQLTVIDHTSDPLMIDSMAEYKTSAERVETWKQPWSELNARIAKLVAQYPDKYRLPVSGLLNTVWNTILDTMLTLTPDRLCKSIRAYRYTNKKVKN